MININAEEDGFKALKKIKPVTNILKWIQCFGRESTRFVGLPGSNYSSPYGDCWFGYDRTFRL